MSELNAERFKGDPPRGTGRTTGRMLHAIANALESPGQWIQFVDHVRMDALSVEGFADSLRTHIRKLGLAIEVRVVDSEISLLNPFAFFNLG